MIPAVSLVISAGLGVPDRAGMRIVRAEPKPKAAPAILRWRRAPENAAMVYAKTAIQDLDNSPITGAESRWVVYASEIAADGSRELGMMAGGTEAALLGCGILPANPIQPGKSQQAVVPWADVGGVQTEYQVAYECVALEQAGGKWIAEMRVHAQPAGKPKGSSPYQNRVIEAWYWFNVTDGRMHEYRGVYSYSYTYKDPKTKKAAEQTYKVGTRLVFERLLDLEGDELAGWIEKTIGVCVRALADKQAENGGWAGSYGESHAMGQTALALLAVCKAGAAKESPVVQKALAYLRTLEMKQVYDVALLCLAIEAYYTPLEELKNTENYDEENSLHKPIRELTPADKAWMQAAAAWLFEHQGKAGAWSYGNASHSGYDNSNSQYGVLGLFAAARCGVFLKESHWQTILDHWLGDQEVKGPEIDREISAGKGGSAIKQRVQARGWGYTGATTARNGTLSMTCAGVSSVAVAHACLAQVDRDAGARSRKAAMASVHGGLAWMETHYTVRPGTVGGWYYYTMYGMERACVITGVRKLGDHNWYREGAAQLCYLKDGDEKNLPYLTSVVDTAFVLLFLKRAASPLSTVTSGK